MDDNKIDIVNSRLGYTPLMNAISKNDIKLTKKLIDDGVDINNANVFGSITPLILAIISDNTEIAKILIDNNADITAVDDLGRNSLLWAANKNNLEISKILIEKSIDIDFHDIDFFNSAIISNIKDVNILKECYCINTHKIRF